MTIVQMISVRLPMADRVLNHFVADKLKLNVELDRI